MFRKLQFDPKVSLGNLLTILGGLLTVIVLAITVYAESGVLKSQQAEMKATQNTLVRSVTRIEAQMELLLGARNASRASSRGVIAND